MLWEAFEERVGGVVEVAGVTGPGLIMLSRIPLPARWSATDQVAPASAALETAYASLSPVGPSICPDVIQITRPSTPYSSTSWGRWWCTAKEAPIAASRDATAKPIPRLRLTPVTGAVLPASDGGMEGRDSTDAGLLVRGTPAACAHLLGDLPLVGETLSLVRSAVSFIGRAFPLVGPAVTIVGSATGPALPFLLCFRSAVCNPVAFIGGSVSLVGGRGPHLQVDVALIQRLVAFVGRPIAFLGCALTVLGSVHP